MRKLAYFMMLVIGVVTIISCNYDETYADQKERERNAIAKNRIDLTPDTDIDAILHNIKDIYANDSNATVNDIDGVKIDFPDSWVHLRKSNTEPIIRVYSEAATIEQADALAKKITDIVN